MKAKSNGKVNYMNLLEILEENKNIILTEAIKIESGEQAFNLIMNKQIGAKVVDDGWFRFLPANKKEFLKKFDDLIEKTENNAPFAFQLAVNKIDPLTFLQVDTRLFSLLANYKNKEWAKKNLKYKKFIELNNKLTKMDYIDLEDLAEKLEDESDKHGKNAKGSGNTKNLEVAYDDGTWTLYIAHSWQAAKAASFYGKKDEKQIPTEWCTRANLSWYNKYTEKNTRPLYIIRNWKTGKSYQMAIRPNMINFLDQKDVKGDKIVKGDLTPIPDGLLEKIVNNGHNLKDYKNKIVKDTNTNGPLEVGNKFKDPEWKIENARWGNEIPLGDGIVKRVWKNYNGGEKDKMANYMIKGEEPSLYVKHNGYWGQKYYFKNNPDFFILAVKNPGKGISKKLLWNGNNGIEEMSTEEFYSNVDDYDKLVDIVDKDSGINKYEIRKNKSVKEYYKNQEKIDNSLFNNVDKISDLVSKNVTKVIKNEIDGIHAKFDATGGMDVGRGAFAPEGLSMDVMDDKTNKRVASLQLRRPKGSLNFQFDNQDVYKTHDMWIKSLTETFDGNKQKALDLDKKILNTINKSMNVYYNQAIKDKNLRNLRIQSRAKEPGLHFEDYFPY